MYIKILGIVLQCLFLLGSAKSAAIHKRALSVSSDTFGIHFLVVTFRVQKAGVAWPGRLDPSLASAFSGSDSSLSWYWNWAPSPRRINLGGHSRLATSSGPPGQFVAMIYNDGTDTSAIPGDSPVMDFNEPDGCEAGTQGCMSNDMDAIVDQYARSSPSSCGKP